MVGDADECAQALLSLLTRNCLNLHTYDSGGGGKKKEGGEFLTLDSTLLLFR